MIGLDEIAAAVKRIAADTDDVEMEEWYLANGVDPAAVSEYAVTSAKMDASDLLLEARAVANPAPSDVVEIMVATIAAGFLAAFVIGFELGHEKPVRGHERAQDAQEWAGQGYEPPDVEAALETLRAARVYRDADDAYVNEAIRLLTGGPR